VPDFEIVLQPRILKSKFVTALIMALRALWRRPQRIHGRHVEACLLTALFGKATGLEIHQLPKTRRKSRIVLFLADKLPTIPFMVVNCWALKDDIVKRRPALQNRIIAAHNGADAPPACEAIDLAPHGKCHAGYVGQLYPGKGMEVIIALAKACPDIIFDIVGGRDDDIAYWRNQAGALDNLVFHGFQAQSRLPAYTAAFDIVLAPYQPEVYGYANKQNIAQWTSPMKVFEYMAAGKAIIASDLPVLQEVLTHNHNAILCPPDDIGVWQQALDQLCKGDALRGKLSNQAQQDFYTYHTWRARAQTIIQAHDGTIQA
jgi:glycosyltransferase involved in cell wall biosynthesis